MNTEKDLFELMGTEKPIIGMIHLKPLPGAPVYQGTGLKDVVDQALNEAQKLVDGGVDALEVENFNDPSYFPDTAPPETVSSISIVGHEIKKAFPSTPLGICVLADPIGSIAVAHCAGAQFIRATVYTEASVDVSGLALRRPHEILRYRKFLDPSIRIFADIHIKHSAPLVDRPIEESAYDAAYFLADAVIISGRHTGFPTPVEPVKKVREILPDFPILTGSGTNSENVRSLMEYASGSIVGTTFKVDGKSTNTVDASRVREFMEVVKRIRNA